MSEITERQRGIASSLFNSDLFFWVSATIGLPVAVGTGLALVFYLTLAEPLPPVDDGGLMTEQSR